MKTAAADQGRIIKMQADMSMIVSESVSQGSLGVGISILIAATLVLQRRALCGVVA